MATVRYKMGQFDDQTMVESAGVLEKIVDEGLMQSRCGIVLLSKNFTQRCPASRCDALFLTTRTGGKPYSRFGAPPAEERKGISSGWHGPVHTAARRDIGHPEPATLWDPLRRRRDSPRVTGNHGRTELCLSQGQTCPHPLDRSVELLRL